ncbi:hypothetical protein BH24ACI3_BH24ACI3_11240 [soil metagenome]
METKTRIFLLIVMVYFFSESGNAQGFRGIVPLESNCGDIKRVFNVEKCSFPVSVFFLEELSIDVHFYSEKPEDRRKCYRVPSGTVTALSITFNKKMPIKDFGYDLKFSEVIVNDIETVVYENAALGVSAYVHDGLVTDAFFIPTVEQRRKFGIPCEVKASH